MVHSVGSGPLVWQIPWDWWCYIITRIFLFSRIPLFAHLWALGCDLKTRSLKKNPSGWCGVQSLQSNDFWSTLFINKTAVPVSWLVNFVSVDVQPLNFRIDHRVSYPRLPFRFIPLSESFNVLSTVSIILLRIRFKLILNVENMIKKWIPKNQWEHFYESIGIRGWRYFLRSSPNA